MCQSNAGGPEDHYTFTLTARAVVNIDTEGTRTTFDSVLSLRRTCTDAATEVACDDDPADILSRRALVTLLGQLSSDPSLRGDGAAAAESARARVAAIDALLPHASDDDEKTALLLERFFAERHELRDHRAAADKPCLLYTSPSPRDRTRSRMPSSA